MLIFKRLCKNRPDSDIREPGPKGPGGTILPPPPKGSMWQYCTLAQDSFSLYLFSLKVSIKISDILYLQSFGRWWRYLASEASHGRNYSIVNIWVIASVLRLRRQLNEATSRKCLLLRQDAQSAKEFSSGDNSWRALKPITFEGWGLCPVVFWSMSSLRLHQLDTAINSYRVCRVERQIAIVSSIVQSQRFRKFGLH